MKTMQKMKECLLIDDDQDDQEIFKMCLRKVNDDINCTAVSDCEEALSMLLTDTEYKPDYIFLDVNMPKMNGIECLKALRKIDHIKASKIFMYSTTSEKKSREETQKLGASDFIVKPAKTVELKDKLAKILAAVSEIQK